MKNGWEKKKSKMTSLSEQTPFGGFRVWSHFRPFIKIYYHKQLPSTPQHHFDLVHITIQQIYTWTNPLSFYGDERYGPSTSNPRGLPESFPSLHQNLLTFYHPSTPFRLGPHYNSTNLHLDESTFPFWGRKVWPSTSNPRGRDLISNDSQVSPADLEIRTPHALVWLR
ncbi:hypothetical protein JTE90_009770 [Oedothorax gibbosus]|uniref:Uncharacterized protein n=1 Tax=Oedothorax gibbosus TaxID=931172 RepID=A0AAV6V7S9_9ARAC|nr:hypothetical protein JTE90_009770 [Oedothorax gibbosus]